MKTSGVFGTEFLNSNFTMTINELIEHKLQLIMYLFKVWWISVFSHGHQ